MTNESSDLKTATSTSSSAADSYIGSFISLTSKYEIRYEGVLYYLNPQDSTLGLKNVKSYGTEGRKKDGPQIPPIDKVYECILFRGSDIKDLQVKSSLPSQVQEPMHNDPAIIQSQYATGPASLLKPLPVSGGSLTELSPYMEASAMSMMSYPIALTSQQSGAQLGGHGPSQVPQNTNFSSNGMSMPMPWQGYNGTSGGIAYAQQLQNPSATTSISLLQNSFEASHMNLSTKIPLTSSSISLPPTSSITASYSSHANIISSYAPEQFSRQQMNLPSLSSNSALSFPHGILNASASNMSSHPPSAQNVNKSEATNTGKVLSNTVTLHAAQSVSCSASSIADSSLVPLLKQSPMLLTPDQLSQPRLPEIAPAHSMHSVHKDTGVLNSASSYSLSLVIAPVMQAPLLQPPRQQFTEEFDFEAMNEKFKKDEVWGYLGKAKKRGSIENIHDNGVVCQTSADKEGDGLVTDADFRPAYNKDDFFDSISCNTTADRGRNGQNRFSERVKLDTETFGQFQQRTHPFYGGHGAGCGLIRHPFGWGREHNPSCRGRGGYMR